MNRFSISIWVRRGSWALTDQALFVLANFTLNILLARWLPPNDYGTFVVSYTLLLLLATLQTGLLTEPMQVFGPVKYKRRFGPYMYLVIKCHIVFSILGSAILLITGIVMWNPEKNVLSDAIITMALTAPFILFFWLMRRACYVVQRPQVAAYSSISYIVLILVGSYAIYRANRLNIPTAFAIMAVASIFSALWIKWQLGITRPRESMIAFSNESLTDHWSYGRWAIITGLIGWIPGNLVYFLLPLWHGLESAGTLRALVNLIMPAQQFFVALAPVLLPAMVEAAACERDRIIKIASIATKVFVLSAILYWVAVAAFAEPIIDILYGQKYTEYAYVFWLLGLSVVCGAFMASNSTAIKALQRPREIMRAHGWSTVVTLTIGVLFIWHLGIIGGMGVLVLANVVPTVLIQRAFHRYVKDF